MSADPQDPPEVPSRTIEEARAELIAELRALPGLTMIGIGECEGAPCLRVHVVAVTDEIRESVPDTLGGWPVELNESGSIRAR